MNRRNQRWLIGGIIIAIAGIIIGFLQFGGNVVYFYTPGEAVAQASELSQSNIKVGGMVLPGSVQKGEGLLLNFRISDLKAHEINIAYNGAPPDMFKEGSGVVVEGRITADGKHMSASKLMVKHSEEYKKAGDHSNMDRALIEKSILKE